jgi:hypothetical protein
MILFQCKEREGLIRCVSLCDIAGYSPEYVEEILHKKKQERASSALAIDLHRPTFIKVNRKYLHPDTLDYYGLPWEWDSVSNTFPAMPCPALPGKQQTNKQECEAPTRERRLGRCAILDCFVILFAEEAFGSCVMLDFDFFLS